MSEQLLLRKGLYADLDNSTKCPIVPGAISITTDEPGIYIDLAADATHSANYRVRIGDFISFPSLQALKDASNNYPVGSTKVYSENALYYAVAENVLCKYVPDATNGGHFVWINDTSSLLNSINTLNQTVGEQGTSITNILNAIGEKTTNHAATKDKTIYKAIEDEYGRAMAAESGLQGQIDTLKGNGDGSIGSLQQQIADLDKAYKEADTGINTTITNLKGDGYNNETVHGNAVNIASNTDRIKAIEDKNIESGAEVNIIEAIGVTISGDGDPSVNIDGDRKANITLPKNLTKYDGTGKLQAIDQSISGINTTITNDIKGSDWGTTGTGKPGSPSLSSNKLAIDAINSKLSGIESGAQVNKVESITVTAGAATTGTISPTTGTKNIALNIPTTLAHLQSAIAGKNAEARVTDIETSITNITKSDGLIAEALQDAKDYTDDEIEKLDENLRAAINTALAGADAMTFKGAVGFKNDGITPNLPAGSQAAPIHAGDTWVLSGEGLDGADHEYHAGDMFVAARDQAAGETAYPDGIIPAGGTLTDDDGWYHVKTGYSGIHESKLSVDDTKNQIKLTSHVGVNLGTVEFITESSNIEITKTAGQTGAINFNLVWATF